MLKFTQFGLFTTLLLVVCNGTLSAQNRGKQQPATNHPAAVSASAGDTIFIEQPNGDVLMKVIDRTAQGTQNTQPRKLYTEPGMDLQPKFPGGEEALRHFISDNLQYPSNDKKLRKEGKMVVEFQLDEEGRVTEAKTYSKGTCTKAMETEALRVIRMMPNWKPALQGGNPVKTTMYLPVQFSLK